MSFYSAMLFLLFFYFIDFSHSSPINTCFDSQHSWSQKKPVIGQTGTGTEWVQKNWEPSIRCLFEERIGMIGDGGKHVCDPSCLLNKPDCVVFSIGSNNDFSFEEAIMPFCPIIHTFDHTVAKPTPPPGVIFHSVGVGRRPYLNFHDLLVLANVSIVKILKIDIEGSEFDFFTSKAVTLMKNHVQQILVEVHIGNQAITSVNNFVSLLTNAGFYPFSKEPNIFGSHGDCFEMSLININRNFL